MSQLAVSTASLVQPHPNVGQTCSCSCACECCCCPSNCNTTCFICPTLDALQWTMGWPDRLASSGIRSMAIRCLLAEMLGTFLLVAFGDGSVAQMVTTEKFSGKALNSYLSVNWGFFCGIAFGVYACGGISGGHINPAVTLAMAIIGKLKWYLVPFYFIGQYVGAFLASVLIYLIYYAGIHQEGKFNYAEMGGIWASKRHPFTTTEMALGDQIFGAFLLVVCVMAITDSKNMAPHKGLVPILVGFVVFGVGLSFGTNAGFAINPARDFAPRIFEAIIFGADAFKGGEYYFWIPIIGPHIGAILGALIYIFMIEMHHQDPQSPPKMSIPLEDRV